MEVVASKRKIFGKQVKKIRNAGSIPAVVFGKRVDSIPISINGTNFTKAFAKTGESTLIDLSIEGENTPRKALISEVQYSPIKGNIIHVNFHQVNLKEKITTKVPVEIVGESPAVKNNKGILITLIDEVEVECLPADIPPRFEVDVSNLNEVDDFISVKDLKYAGDKVSIDLDPEELIIKVDYAEQLKEEEEAVSVENIEVTGEKPKEESAEEGTEKETEEKGEEKEDFH